MGSLEGRSLDRYELKQLIGRGGMADVYLGYDSRFERAVAVKVFRRDDEDLLRRFVREARLMGSLRHACLMPIYDAGESLLDGKMQYYIAMPFMEHGTLRDRIHRLPPLSLQEIACYLTNIADALDYIHKRGIIHRDIKSSNVLLDSEGRCYLSDFGIARTSTDATMTTTGEVLGTVDYVAPELFEEGQKASTYSDLYSLGVLAFEMVTRRFPFSAESQVALIAMHINNQPPSPRSLAPHISIQTEKVMLKALTKRPEQRYASVITFAEAFCLSLTPRSGESTTSEVKRGEPVDASQDDTKGVTQPASLSVTSVRSAPPASSTEDHFLPATDGPFAQPGQSSPAMRHSAHLYRIVRGLLVLALLSVIIVPALLLSPYSHQAITTNLTPAATAPVIQMHMTTTATTVKATVAPAHKVTVPVSSATATVVYETPNATRVVAAQQTATEQGNDNATASVVQTATAGTPLYTDPLNDSRAPATSQANWDERTNCTFQSDGYHALSNNALITCMENNHSYGDATISVDMTLLSGQSGGVAFRMSSVPFVGNYAGYLFEVDSQGNYSISCTSITSGTTVLQEGSIPRGFRSGYHVKNTLQIIMNGGSLSFYVNGVFLDQETTTSAAGMMGFLALAASVVYSNLRISSVN